MAVHFTLDDKDVKKIETAISQSGVNAEQVINNYLRTRAPEKIIPSIVGLMPISERKKKHARASNPLTHQNFNLSVVVKTKNEYWYLQFPNDATGTSERKYYIRIYLLIKNIYNLFNILLSLVTVTMIKHAFGRTYSFFS